MQALKNKQARDMDNLITGETLKQFIIKNILGLPTIY